MPAVDVWLMLDPADHPACTVRNGTHTAATVVTQQQAPRQILLKLLLKFVSMSAFCRGLSLAAAQLCECW